MPAAMPRRTFLLTGGVALAVAACSGGSKAKSTTTTSSPSRPAWNLAALYAADALAAGAVARLSYGLADADGAFPKTLPIQSLAFEVMDDTGRSIGPALTVPAHGDGLPRPYFPVAFTPPKQGNYTISTNVLGTPLQDAVSIGDGGTVPRAGQPLIPFDTPTAADHKGVDLLCTRNPPCPFHDVTVTAALAEKRPLAFLIATPAYCKVGICGPVLDLLVEAQASFPQVRFLHSEVYPTVDAAQPNKQQTVPVIAAYGLSYEPVLFLTKPDGTVATRLDTIYDRGELRGALSALVA